MRSSEISVLSSWQKRCTEVGHRVGVEVVFHDKDHATFDAYEDDGTLHIQKPGEPRACFDVSNGQSLSGLEQNQRTVKIMTDLRLKRFITDRVLVEEHPASGDDEESTSDRCCSQCGRPF